MHDLTTTSQKAGTSLARIRKNAKRRKVNCPPRYTENLVTMYNKYGALDTEEGMESDAEAGKG